ncbi:unnamed protein product [Closterium sp. Yama58-4]|nr:unnamed protein product [Closterium sp. Yama58-4]
MAPSRLTGTLTDSSVRKRIRLRVSRDSRARSLWERTAEDATRQQAIITLASRHQTFSSFDDLIHSSDLVLVDFYATWCGPCKHMAGVLQSLSHRLLASVKIVKIDTEKYPALASQYGITALPTIVLFRHGRPVDRIEGVLPPEELILRLGSLLAPSHTH